MENKETVINESNKLTETLTKELENLSNEELHEFFKTRKNCFNKTLYTVFTCEAASHT